MVIGVDASRANKKEKTGTEWYAHTLLRSLASVETNSTLRLYSNTPLEASLSNLGLHVEERVLRWPPKRLWTQLRLSAEMLAHPPDVLFVPAHTIPVFHPKATVMTAHDVGFARSPELYAPRELLYHRWAMRFALNHARCIIVPSDFTRREILALYPAADPRKLVVIHHGFDPAPFEQRASDGERACILDAHGIRKPYCFYVGRLQEKKNIPRLVEAFGQFLKRHQDRQNVQLVLAGEPDFGFDRVKRFLEQYQLSKNVIFPGYIERKSLMVLLQEAALFAFPSLYEGFGFPVLEAQAAGTPVLTSSAASLPEVGGSGAYYVNPESTMEIADALHVLLTDDRVREELIRRGHQNLDRFSWTRCAEKTVGVLKKAATQPVA